MNVPVIDQVALVVEEDAAPPPPLHLSDLLPGWKSASGGEPVQPRAAALNTPNETAPKDAISHGAALPQGYGPTTLAEALERAARESPEKGVVYIRPDGTEFLQTYPALRDEAQRLLSGLRGLGLKPRDKVLFQLERNEDFIPAFWGCVLGGFVPVPLSIAQTSSAMSKLQNAWQMLGRPIILTGKKLDELRLCEADRSWHESRPDDMAILLLTSGSTGLPKAVMQSHGRLLSQVAGSIEHYKFSRAEVSLNWQPLDHVGGIVMFHLRDVCLGSQQVHVPTELILQEPLQWLDLMARFRATLTWAPNFAFALVNAQEPAIRERRWDLSAVRSIVNGGEAVSARTARRFLRLLRPHGLSETCMHPAWGMSETASAVTYSDRFSLATTSDDEGFVELGAPIPGFSMRIVDANGQLVPEGVIGRLQVKGASVTPGYYENPELTRRAFGADGWFETGDLGLLRGGRLTLTGREKDLIIINGVNYQSHEIEAVVEEIPGVAVSYTAACPVRSSASDTDELAVFFHPARGDDGMSGLLKAIREKIVKTIGVNPHYLVPVEKSAIPKTALGKIQRTQLSQRFKAGEFDAVLKRVDILSGNANTLPAWFYRKVWQRKPLAAPRNPREIRPSLVLMDRSGLGAILCDEMPCVRVEMGPDFARLASERYRIDPRQPEHYQRLLASIAADGIRIEQVLHLWTCDSSSPEDLERSQDRGVYSLLFLIQALARREGDAAPLDLYVASTASYENAPLLGLLRTAPHEMPWLHCRHVELPAADASVNAAHVLGEIQSAAGDREVAYRNGERWIPRLQRVDFASTEKHELPFKRGGMYLISGGLGGIGTEIARYLLQEYGAKLLLVGRTPHRELPELPGAVAYEALDVCDLAALRRAVERAKERWQCPLDGILHFAGIYQERLLTQETRDSFAAVLHAKVFGTWALAQLLEDRPDKLFISFSSASSFFGGALVGAYTAANAFLGSFTQHQRRTHSVKSYCLEWSMWDEVGMSRGYAMKELARRRGYYILSKRQGLYSFLAALRHGEPHVLVGLDVRNRAQRFVLRSEPTAPQTPLESRIAGFWREVLALPQLGVHDNFFDLGGNSLSATRIVSRIRDAFGVRLALRVMFDDCTVAKLASVLERQLREKEADRGDSIAPVAIEQLSDEEVRSLLNEMQ